MSSFTSPLVVSPCANGRDWTLIDKFTYHIGSKFSRHYVNVPGGFVTDFASVPRMFFFLPDWATYHKAAVLHDWLYKCRVTSRKRADDIFMEAMLIDWRGHRSRYFVAKLEYWTVRMFGWLAWH